MGFLAILFLEIVFDHIVGMPYWLRWTILSAAWRPAASTPAFRLVLPWSAGSMRCTPPRRSRMSEPAFKNSLINYLELQRHREQLPKAVLATLESRAVNDLTQVDVDARSTSGG